MVAPGNPKRVRTFKDLGKKGLRLVNRQAGSGSGTRTLLEHELARAGVAGSGLAGWEREAATHYEVALAVHAGEADVGIASAAAAGLTGLGFVPLRYRERVKYADGAQTPRYRLVAVYDLNLRVFGHHLRMSELKAIAQATGAELVALPRGEHSGHKRLEALQGKAGPEAHTPSRTAHAERGPGVPAVRTAARPLTSGTGATRPTRRGPRPLSLRARLAVW